MEQRHFMRLQLALRGEIWKGDRYLGRFKTREVSHAGMSIPSGTFDLAVDDTVKIIFSMVGGPIDRKYEMTGVVVHKVRECVGIIFLSRNQNYTHELFELKNSRMQRYKRQAKRGFQTL